MIFRRNQLNLSPVFYATLLHLYYVPLMFLQIGVLPFHQLQSKIHQFFAGLKQPLLQQVPGYKLDQVAVH